MSERSTNRDSIPRKVSLCVLLVVLTGLLGPFAIVGESWGMMWMLAAAPVSFILEERIGIGAHAYLLIAFGSLAVAVFWSGVAFAISKLIAH